MFRTHGALFRAASPGRLGRSRFIGCWLIVLFGALGLVDKSRAADNPGAVVHYQLPVDGPLPRTYLVTLAVTDQ